MSRTTITTATDINTVLRAVGIHTHLAEPGRSESAMEKHDHLAKAAWRLAQVANDTLYAGISTADVDRWDRAQRSKLKP